MTAPAPHAAIDGLPGRKINEGELRAGPRHADYLQAKFNLTYIFIAHDLSGTLQY